MATKNPTLSVVLDGLDFSFQDGRTVFQDLTFSLPAGSTGIIGPNGLGKSVLLRLIAGELTPDAGTLHVPDTVVRMPQRLVIEDGRTVADELGVGEVLPALDELNAGEADAARVMELVEVIGERWDAEQEALAELRAVGLSRLADDPAVLRRELGTLSGGEGVLVALAGVRAQRPGLTLLDEPSNNLDAGAKAALIDAIASWGAPLVVVSHDRALLRGLDAILELKARRVRAGRADGVIARLHGGWGAYEERVANERAAAQRRLSQADASLSQERTARVAAEKAAAHRSAQGKKAAESMPKILAGLKARSAQESAGKARSERAARVAAAEDELFEAREALKEVGTIDINLAGSRLPTGTTALRGTVPALPETVLLDDGRALAPGEDVSVVGPEVVALSGRNGSGKSTLIAHLLPQASVPVGVLRQRRGTGQRGEGLDEELSAMDTVRAAVPSLSEEGAREVLARLRLRADRALEPVRQLSGGERFRVDLASVLAAVPAPQFLVLDEPSNDLDLESIVELARALGSFGGAILVVSHDDEFIEALAPSRRWELVDPVPEAEAVEAGDAEDAGHAG